MHRLSLAAVAVVCMLANGIVAAQENYPSKPIHVIIPFSAGSATDIVPRTVFEPMSAALGQTIVVENRGGAGGIVGTAAVAKAEPDGYTLLAHSAAHSVSPSIYASIPYDAAADFAGIITFGNAPTVLVVAPSKGTRRSPT